MATALLWSLVPGINQKLNEMLGDGRLSFLGGSDRRGSKPPELSPAPRASCLLGDRLSSAISFKLLFREDYQFFFSKLPIVEDWRQGGTQAA